MLKEILFRNVSFLLCDCKSSAKTHWVKVCQFKNSRSLFKNVNVVPMRDFSLQVFSVENWLFVGWKVSILKLNFRNSHYSGQIKFIFRFSLNQKSSHRTDSKSSFKLIGFNFFAKKCSSNYPWECNPINQINDYSQFCEK